MSVSYVQILAKNMKLSIFHGIWGFFRKYYKRNRSSIIIINILERYKLSIYNSQIYNSQHYFNLNWIWNFLLENGILRYMYLTRKFKNMKKSYLLEKILYKIEKMSSTKYIFFKFYIWIRNICRNRLVKQIYDLEMMFKIWKHVDSFLQWSEIIEWPYTQMNLFWILLNHTEIRSY